MNFPFSTVLDIFHLVNMYRPANLSRYLPNASKIGMRHLHWFFTLFDVNFTRYINCGFISKAIS